jgi:hypothetical protein
MIGNIRSYYSRNNKTIRLATRNRHRDNILDASDDSYFYITLSRFVRNKRYPTLREREYINNTITNQFYNQHNFHYVCIKCMLKHKRFGLRILKGDE